MMIVHIQSLFYTYVQWIEKFSEGNVTTLACFDGFLSIIHGCNHIIDLLQRNLLPGRFSCRSQLCNECWMMRTCTNFCF